MIEKFLRADGRGASPRYVMELPICVWLITPKIHNFPNFDFVRGKTPSTADLSIENYPQTADVPAMGDRPRLRSWFSPYKIYDVGGVWILDVAACSQHRVDQFYVYREMSQRPLRWLRGKNALPAIIP